MGQPDETRRQPVQSRARRSVRKILDAAIEILIADGLPGLNTNLVAQRAGVNVATLYAYFPDKLSIVRQLAEQFEALRGDYVAERAADLPTTNDWAHWFEEVIDRLAQFRVEESGGVALRRAILSSPELRPIDEASTDRATEANLPGFLAHGPRLTEARARAASRVVATTITTMLDSAFATEPYDTTQIDELKVMIVSYLRNYLD